MLLAACAGTPAPEDTGQALDRACSVSECFYERDVRDFEVINDTTLIVYVGGQRCPFRVELEGTFCDMSMAPELFFRPASRGVDLEANYGSNRICAYDRVDVDGGPFTETFDQPTDAFGVRRSQCRVRDVVSLTDDELVELYVARGVVAPPPPIGPGRIEVKEEEETLAEGETAEAAEGQAAPSDSSEATPPLPPARDTGGG
ncbi:MAG TPA: hypothetical protein VF322_13035 [Gammaproteobacteria bacterium]